MVAWVATLLVLSVSLRELLSIKRESATDQRAKEASGSYKKVDAAIPCALGSALSRRSISWGLEVHL